jgi:hypothetical protein
MQTLHGAALGGNLCLAACCAFYLAWWAVAFRPGTKAPLALSTLLFLAALASGICGAWLLAGHLCRPTADLPGLVSRSAVIIGCLAAYVALLAVSRLVFHRMVTTELALIVLWLAMALCQADGFYAAGLTSRGAALALFAAALLIAVIAFVCYLMYYRLEPLQAYVCGMIPLILVGIYALACAAAVH